MRNDRKTKTKGKPKGLAKGERRTWRESQLTAAITKQLLKPAAGGPEQGTLEKSSAQAEQAQEGDDALEIELEQKVWYEQLAALKSVDTLVSRNASRNSTRNGWAGLRKQKAMKRGGEGGRERERERVRSANTALPAPGRYTYDYSLLRPRRMSTRSREACRRASCTAKSQT